MWNERYSTAGYFYGKEPNEFLADHAHLIPVGPVLCLAEGEGRNAVFLAGRGHTVTALDQSHVGLEKARRLAGERGVKISTVVADLHDYKIEAGDWSGIISIWAHLPQALRGEVHAACVAGLAPGGVFILEAYTPDQLRHGTGGPRDIALFMTRGDLEKELRGLDFLVAREIEREIQEGCGHDGLSATVQIAARKPQIQPG